MEATQKDYDELSDIVNQIHGRCLRLETVGAEYATKEAINGLTERLTAIYGELPEPEHVRQERRRAY